MVAFVLFSSMSLISFALHSVIKVVWCLAVSNIVRHMETGAEIGAFIGCCLGLMVARCLREPPTSADLYENIPY